MKTQLKRRDLSEREQVICRLIGEGKGPNEISKYLGIAVSTVESLRARARHKVGLHGRVFNAWCAVNSHKFIVESDPFIDVKSLPPIPEALPLAPKRPIVIAPDPDQLTAPGTPTMNVKTFVSVYQTEHDIARTSAEQYLRCMTALEKFAGSSLRLCDVSPDICNQFLHAMKEHGRSDSTRRGWRQSTCVLLRWAVKRGDLVSFPFDRVQKVRIRDRVTRAWTYDDVLLLLDAAKELRGEYPSGIGKAIWWKSYILAAWDSALRSCDLLSIERSWIAADGAAMIVQHKTGHRHRVFFQSATLAAIDECMTDAPRRSLVWPLWGRREVFPKAARRLLDASGLPGSMKWIRRASATALEKEHPGAAARHLGHKTPGMAEKYYLDHNQLNEVRPLPPALQTV